jgi:hypothetical protein
VKRLWPYLKTFLVIFIGIAVISTGMYWGIKTWGMRNVHVDIDWVDFIKFNDIMYLASDTPVTVSTDNLMPYDTVRFMLSGNVDDPNYRSKNGDAAFLQNGTPVYSVVGYSPSYRLWAGGLLFEAYTSPKARKGSDLLDIGGKVDYIETDPAAGVIIREPARVAALVDMILNAPVNQKIQSKAEGQIVTVFFHLKDGTTVRRGYWPDQGLLSRGIMLPEEFWEILKMGDGEVY